MSETEILTVENIDSDDEYTIKSVEKINSDDEYTTKSEDLSDTDTDTDTKDKTIEDMKLEILTKIRDEIENNDEEDKINKLKFMNFIIYKKIESLNNKL
jgi:hypothetical protein